jgi:hypothetical protein
MGLAARAARLKGRARRARAQTTCTGHCNRVFGWRAERAGAGSTHFLAVWMEFRGGSSWLPGEYSLKMRVRLDRRKTTDGAAPLRLACLTCEIHPTPSKSSNQTDNGANPLRTHSHNQTKEGLEPSPKHGLEPFQPTDPTTKHTVKATPHS